MLKRNWIVYAVTDNTVFGVEAHKLQLNGVTKKQAIDSMYNYLSEPYSFRNIRSVKAIKI